MALAPRLKRGVLPWLVCVVLNACLIWLAVSPRPYKDDKLYCRNAGEEALPVCYRLSVGEVPSVSIDDFLSPDASLLDLIGGEEIYSDLVPPGGPYQLRSSQSQSLIYRLTFRPEDRGREIILAPTLFYGRAFALYEKNSGGRLDQTHSLNFMNLIRSGWIPDYPSFDVVVPDSLAVYFASYGDPLPAQIPVMPFLGDAIEDATTLDPYVFFVFIGSMMVILVYNASIAITVRRKEHFYYLAYVASVSIMLASMNTPLFLRPFADLPDEPMELMFSFALMAPISFGFISAGFFTKFYIHFASMRLGSFSWRFFQAQSTLGLLLGGVSVISLSYGYMSGTWLVLSGHIVLLGLLSICIHSVREAIKKRDFLPASILPGIIILMALSWIYLEYNNGRSDVGFLAKSAGSMGPLLEATLLSLALGYKVRRTLMEKIKRIKGLYHEISKMAPGHVLAHIENGGTVETSTPVGTKDGVIVVCLDVISSSSIKCETYKWLIDAYKAKCYELMAENYSPSPLSANAYRLQDTGDGFVGSIGFPYALSPLIKENAATHAVRLSIKFLDLFQLMVASRLEGRVRCSIGICTGEVEGYFTSGSVKQYDLRGRALIRSIRYEKLRNFIIPRESSEDSYFIITDEKTMASLSGELTHDFVTVETRPTLGFIRDDPEALNFYFLRYRVNQSGELYICREPLARASMPGAPAFLKA